MTKFKKKKFFLLFHLLILKIFFILELKEINNGER